MFALFVEWRRERDRAKRAAETKEREVRLRKKRETDIELVVIERDRGR